MVMAMDGESDGWCCMVMDGDGDGSMVLDGLQWTVMNGAVW